MNSKTLFFQRAGQTLSLLIGLSIITASAQSQSYTVHELKPLDKGTSSRAFSINAKGKISGVASSGDSSGRGAFWDIPGGMPTKALGLVGSFNSYVLFYGLDDTGETAGYYDDGSDYTRLPLFWRPGDSDLTMLPIGDFKRGEARGICDLLSAGDYFAIAGTVYTSLVDGGNSRAAVWNKKGEMKLLPALTQDAENQPGNEAWSISDLGFVGGSSAKSGTNLEQAVVWFSTNQSLVAWLNDPDVVKNGGVGGKVYSVRDNRYYCGYIYPPTQTPVRRACYWPSLTECHMLGTLGGDQSWAYSVRDSNMTKNNRVEMVGASEIPGSYHSLRAFVYDPTHGMRDLNNLIPVGSDWILEGALDIDPQGRIVGAGIYHNEYRGFLLIPVAMAKILPNPAVLKSLQRGFVEVEMLDAVPVDTTIAIRASNGAVQVPSSITIKRGLQRASFAITATTVRQQTDVTLTLTLDEQEMSTRVTVTP